MLVMGSAHSALSKASGLLQEPCEAVLSVVSHCSQCVVFVTVNGRVETIAIVLTDSATQSCKRAHTCNRKVPWQLL